MTIDRKIPFKLGDWLVEPEFNHLTSGDESHRVEPKVMSVLLYLATCAPRVATKDEILQAVWPDTFVGEDALTRCVSMLRHILDDSPHSPRFIKTIPKVGYCLLVEVLPYSPPAAEQASQQPDPAAPSMETSSDSLPEPPSIDRRKAGLRLAAVILLLAALSGISFIGYRSSRVHSVPPAFHTFQLTTDAGEQSRPAWSPDGKQIAFVWQKEGDSQQHIYIQNVDSNSLVRLTSLPDSEYSPAWSPDGKQIAFLSSSKSGLGLYIAALPPAKSVRRVYIPGDVTRWDEGALSWSPDGKSLVLDDHIDQQPSSSIYLIDMETLRAHPLTVPPAGWEGDLSPVFSPDGQKIAFVRASENFVENIYWIPAGGGTPHSVTHDGKMIKGIAWSPDSHSILFASNRGGTVALWKTSLDGSATERLPVGTDDATQPAVTPWGHRVAYVQASAISGILRVRSAKDEPHEAKSSVLVSSTAGDSAPSISPDGKQFAFQSWRMGTQQVWISSIDGLSLRQLTPSGGQLDGSGSPSWSPRGDRVAFDSRIYGHSHIFLITPSGGNPQQLTFGDVNDIVPRWSSDQRSLYFRSNRGGRWQLWKVSALGGTPQPITADDGMVGQESPDGKWLYFARGDQDGIWRVSTAGGKEERVLDQPSAGFWAYWEVSSEGIYFLDQRQSTPSISVYDPVSQKISGFAKLDRVPPTFAGLCVLPGGHGALISDRRDAGSHISIAEGVF